MTMKPCRFSFDGTPDFDGFTDGTTWNGWANVWCTPETRDAVAVAMVATYGEDETIDDFRALTVNDNGLVSFAYGYTPYITEEDEKPSITFRTQFMDHDAFDLCEKVLALGFEDESWNQDCYPLFFREVAGELIKVGVNYRAPALREPDTNFQFCAYLTDLEGNETGKLYAGDSWQDLTFAITVRIAHHDL